MPKPPFGASMAIKLVVVGGMIYVNAACTASGPACANARPYLIGSKTNKKKEHK